MSNKKELKPCPFCGNDAYLFQLNNSWVISCQNPNEDDCIYGAIVDDDLVQWIKKEDAIKMWNKRII